MQERTYWLNTTTFERVSVSMKTVFMNFTSKRGMHRLERDVYTESGVTR